MKPKKRTYQFLLYTNVLLVLITILSALSANVDPRVFWLFSFFGLVFPFLVFANILFILWWFSKKMRYSLLSIVCLLVFSSQVGNSFGFNLTTDHIEQVDSFSIASYNTSNLKHNANSSEEVLSNRRKAVQFIASEVGPDVLCTQELGGRAISMLLGKFKNYFIHKIPKKGALIFSRYPFVNTGEIDFITNTNSCVWADVKIHSDTIRVYSVHLQSNNITKQTDQVLNDKTNQKNWSKIKKILGRYKKYNIRRADQADMVSNHIKNSPHPVIVCGDLNDTPQSYTYKTISNNLNDAFIEEGFGLGVTFGGNIPGLRIDYILADPSLKIIDYKKYKKAYSDHYLIHSVLKME